MPGLGTLLNIAAILVGTAFGVLIGNRLPERTREIVTDALGLIVLVIGALNIVMVTNQSFEEAVGAPLLVVLGAMLIGGLVGSFLRVEQRLESLGLWLHRRFVKGGSSSRFIEGFVDASLLFCIGPLAILGPLSDGLGQGIEQLALKSTLDGFASLAFAASLGWGVAASALSVGVIQGLFTVVGAVAGSVASEAVIASLTATGGVLLLGVGMRLLNLKQVAVADLLPALVAAPLLTLLVASFR